MSPPILVDIGANLGHRRFAPDLAAVLARAAAAGVTRMVVTGTSLPASQAARRLAAAHRGVLWSTAGVHPHEARNYGPRTSEALAELARDPCVRAIGECGLDFDRDFSPRPAQERAFEAQLELAAACGLPVFLHERSAHERFLAILARRRAGLSAGVVHCFTGTAAELDAYLDLDLHIGITGWICDDRRGAHLEPLIRRIPEDRLLVETDSPFLLPRDLSPRPRDGRNEPSHLPHVAARVARATGRPLAEIAAATTRNAVRLFQLA